MNKKSKGTAFALWLFFGIWGIHRFYLESPLIAILQFFTFGGLGFWWLLDLFLISGRVNLLNAVAHHNNMNNAGNTINIRVEK